jgi:predicted RNA-binding protein YlxR (DUF448 family)
LVDARPEVSEVDAGGREAAGGQLRLCVATRVERPPEQLIRFVVAPDGTLVADLARRLPGRGVWVTADRTSIAKAAKVNAFARSLKRAVKVPPDIIETTEKLLARRALDALALANKAGLVTTGFAQVEALLAEPRILALVHGADAAPGGREKLDRKYRAIATAAGRDTVIVDWLTIDEISLAIGRLNVVHAGLTNGGAGQRFLGEARRLQRYRSGFDTPPTG